jgi:protein-S-isoprenylcysteine O-methyltransferase Ste14
MTIYGRIIFACWLIFLLYWCLSAIGTKRTVGPRPWRQSAGLGVVIVVLVVLALRIPTLRYALRDAQHFATGAGPVSAVLCAAGVGFAIWARAHLGRNWGMPMSRKEDPELVTTGPYAFVRHPIYSGLLLAMLGSTLGKSVVWLVPFLVCIPYFILSARGEERIMREQFPAQYAAYMRRTWMLVPYVL